MQRLMAGAGMQGVALPASLTAASLCYVLETGDLVAGVIRPKGQPRYRAAADTRLAIDTTDRIALQLGWLLDPWISRLSRTTQLRTSITHHGKSAYVLGSQALVQGVREWLKAANARIHGRISLSGVESWLFRRLLERYSDHAFASLGTGRPHRQGDTGLHYLCILACEVADRVNDLIRSLHAEISEGRGPVVDGSMPLSAACRSEPPDGVGSPVVPAKETVGKIAKALETHIRLACNRHLDDDLRLQVHNAYAHYTHTLLRYALGLRDVGVALPGWERLDPVHGVAMVSDKDDVAGSATRLVPLCSIALRQLEFWGAHCRATLSRLPVPIPDPLPVIVYLARAEKGKIEIVRRFSEHQRAELRSILPWYDLPLNANRHWLRTSLTKLGAFGEQIEFAMGHWVRGTAPWERFSALSPHDLIEATRPAVDRLMQDTGFVAIRGWG